MGCRSYPRGFVPAADPRRNARGFLSYEDERPIAAKAKWVRDTQPGGTIIWTVNYGYLRASKTNPPLGAGKARFLQR